MLKEHIEALILAAKNRECTAKRRQEKLSEKDGEYWKGYEDACCESVAFFMAAEKNTSLLNMISILIARAKESREQHPAGVYKPYWVGNEIAFRGVALDVKNILETKHPIR